MIKRTSNKWTKKRCMRLANEIEAFIQHKSKQENGGHDINDITTIHERAACGMCDALRGGQKLARMIGQVK